MELKSPETLVSKPAEVVFTMLTDVRNFEKLMPDNTIKFEVTGNDKFVFALKGMPEIALKLSEKYPTGKIIYEAAEGKVPFTLTARINKTAAEKSNVQFVFNGQFNTMMGMMIKKPIRNFLDVLSKNTIKL